MEWGGGGGKYIPIMHSIVFLKKNLATEQGKRHAVELNLVVGIHEYI